MNNVGKIDRTVMKALDMVEKLEKLFANNGAFENAVMEIGGDISYFGDVRRTLKKLYGELEDLHYGALAHLDETESVTESVRLTEGVLDGDDEDGFMARSQLYFLAKDAISLHGMISDRDNLEPWVQSKITTAANDIEAVRRYTEYNNQQADRQLPVPTEEPAHDMEMEEGWETMPAIDTERYGPRDGLEGPFQTRVGKVVYYDPKAGKYYDPDSDHYLEYDEWRQLDKPGTPLRNEVAEGKGKPDFLDLDKDGNKKEPMKKAAKDAKKVEEGMDFDDKRNDDLKQIASDMFSHAKKAAARKVK